MTPPRRKPWSCLLGGAGILLLIWVTCVLLALVDEAAVPADTGFPQAPPSAAVRGISTQCGSGGCWREMEIALPSFAAAAGIAARMGVGAERCGARNPLTLRRTCTGSTAAGDRLLVYLRYSY